MSSSITFFSSYSALSCIAFSCAACACMPKGCMACSMHTTHTLIINALRLTNDHVVLPGLRICICALYLSVKPCMRMSITQILTTLCVQFYTCMHNGDVNKLQRAWNNLKVVKHQMNWAEWREYNTLHEQLLFAVAQRLHETLPNFTWYETETPFFLLSAVPALDEVDPLHDTTWFAHCRKNGENARNKNSYTDANTDTRKNITQNKKINPYIISNLVY